MPVGSGTDEFTEVLMKPGQIFSYKHAGKEIYVSFIGPAKAKGWVLVSIHNRGEVDHGTVLEVLQSELF